VKKLRMAVIGVGYLGRLHALKLASHPEVKLAYLVDVRKEQAVKVAEEIKKEFSITPEVREHFEEVVKEVDAVSIATTTVSHYEVAKRFLEEGIPLFLEKPIAHRLELVEELIEKRYRSRKIEKHLEAYERMWELADCEFSGLFKEKTIQSIKADMDV